MYVSSRDGIGCKKKRECGRFGGRYKHLLKSRCVLGKKSFWVVLVCGDGSSVLESAEEAALALNRGGAGG